MRKVTVLLLMASSLTGLSQSVDYNKIILPGGVSSVSFEEKLVQLAWANHPTNRISQLNVNMFRKEKSIATWSWLDNATATFNVNQFTLDPSTDVLGRAGFLPRYNLSFRLSLGTFVNTPLQTKVANDRILISEQQVNELKLVVRREVLSNVEMLKERYKIYRLRDRLREDFLILFKDAEKKFSNGEIKIDQYQLASQAYNTRAESVISALSMFNQSKIQIDAMIGVKVDEVEGYAEFIIKLETELQSN